MKHLRTFFQAAALFHTAARAHVATLLRIAALLVLASLLAMVWLVVSMMSDLNMMTPQMDGTIVALRLFAAVALPLGALAGLWNAKVVLTGRRSWWAKAWSVLLAAAFLLLLWLGLRYHLPGLHAFY